MFFIWNKNFAYSRSFKTFIPWIDDWMNVMNQSNFWMFVHFSVISHSRLALLSSLAASDTSFGLQSLKYRPLTFSKSGSRAANKVVCAPLLVVLKSKYFKGTNKMLQRK